MTNLATTTLAPTTLDRTEAETEFQSRATAAAAYVPDDLRVWRYRLVRLGILLLLTSAAVLVHGYHLGADDAEIYVPAIKRVADPQLYPFNAQFFQAHSHLSLFAWLGGGSARLLHLPVDVAIFGWQMVSIFVLVMAAWRMASLCFARAAARWGAVALLMASLSVPVAGTALPIMDPYLDSRSLSTPMILLAIAAYLGGRKKSALAWLGATVLIHPLMAVYGAGLIALSEVQGWMERRESGGSRVSEARRGAPAYPTLRYAQDGAPAPVVPSHVSEARRGVPAYPTLRYAQDGVPAPVVPSHVSEARHGAPPIPSHVSPEGLNYPNLTSLGWGTRTGALTVLALGLMLAVPLALPRTFPLGPARGVYREVLYSRPFFFVFRWHWYEWVGVLAPLAILYTLERWRPRGTLEPFRAMIAALMPLAAASVAYAMLLGSTHQFDYWARLQPMRSFHLVYIFLFLFLGGVLGEFFLKQQGWRWLALFLPLGAGMYALAHGEYPHSRQVELPAGHAGDNAWLQAFFWIRANTPKDAVFALSPVYLRKDDTHGFRAIAERSALADAIKDSGAVSMFPELAEEWKRQQQAQAGWRHFSAKDFERLRQGYGVDWVVVENPAPAGLVCPYRNAAVSVCRVGVVVPAVQADLVRGNSPIADSHPSLRSGWGTRSDPRLQK